MIDAATRRLVRERAGNRCEYSDPQSSRHFPSAVASRLRRSGGRHSESDDYFGNPDASAFQPISSDSDSDSAIDLNAQAIDRIRRMAGALGAFTKSRLATFKSTRPSRKPSPSRSLSFLMSHEVLATLWHPPTEAAQAERMQAREFPARASPATQKRRTVGTLICADLR